MIKDIKPNQTPNQLSTIRTVKPEDTDALIGLCKATDLFVPGELEILKDMLSQYFEGDLGDDHFWIKYEDDDELIGIAYYAPETFADSVFNLYLIGIHPDRQREGLGTILLRHVEEHLMSISTRMLIIETSGLGSFDRTRAFYRKNGYDEEARIRDFYRAGDDKIIFRKTLVRPEGVEPPTS